MAELPSITSPTRDAIFAAYEPTLGTDFEPTLALR